MKLLSFLHKVAFICNLCYLSTFVLKTIDGVEDYQSYIWLIVLLGYIGFLFNALVIIASFVCFFSEYRNLLPKYLFVFNLVLFLIQFGYFLM